MRGFFCKTVNKEEYIDVLHHLRNGVRRKRLEKMENQQLVSPAQQCSSTPISCGQEKCNNNGASSIFSDLAAVDLCLFL